MTKITKKVFNSMGMLLIALSLIGCYSNDSDSSTTLPIVTSPSVSSTLPGDGDMTEGVLTGNISATFTKELDPSTIISPSTTFTLIKKAVGAVTLSGVVTYSGQTATFNPTADLEADTEYTATITVAAADLAGNPMAVSKIWSFTTLILYTNPAPINLGAAGTFAIFGNSGISTVPTSVITGDIGTTSAASYLTGFGALPLDGTGTYSTSTQIGGGVTISPGARIHLIGGALAKNIFWQTPGAVVLSTATHLEGIVLSKTEITMATGATVNGRLLSQTAVTLDANTVTEPAL